MSNTVTVVLVEDNPVDVEAVRRAFERHRIANPIVEFHDGRAALNALQGGEGSEAISRPFLVLLDLNMPRMNGLEFLRELRADPALHDSIVFVLTTSKKHEDIAAAYGLHVAGYIVKSEVGEGFLQLVSLLDNYWRVVELPTSRGTSQ